MSVRKLVLGGSALALWMALLGAAALPALAAPPEAPAVDSESAAGVSSTGATLEAQVNPENLQTTYSFEYSTEASGETLQGTIVTLPGAAPLAAEFGDRAAAVATGAILNAGETYFYRVVAENATGATDGPVQSFTTVPTPSTDPVSAITASTATLNGHLTLNPVDTQFYFVYNAGPECTGQFGTPGGDAGSGAGTAAETAEIGELQPFTVYTACFVTFNAFGAQLGQPVPFMTNAVAPAVDSESSSGVSATGAALSASINTENQETSYAFEYSTEEAGGDLTGTIATVNGASPLPAAVGDQGVGVSTGVLQPRTTYYYRVVATNASSETTHGEVKSFKTLAAPIVTTAPAQSVTRTTAALSGTVNPGGIPTRYRFVYVDEAHYLPGAGECAPGGACAYAGGRVSAGAETGSDYTVHAAGPLTIEELTPGTTYHYALVANNSEGTTIGPDQTFTTAPATPPVAVSGEASGVTQLAATLTGTVDTRELPTRMQFEVGTAPEQGVQQTATVIPGSRSGSTVAISLAYGGDLQPGVTYYYRVVATNADGTSHGAERSFTTGSFPAAFASPPPAPALIPFTSIAAIEATEAREDRAKTPIKPLTRAQKLAKALRTCKRDRARHKRVACERQARRQYGPANRKK